MAQNKFRHANLSSKSLVAFAAIHVTGFAFTQNAEIALTGTFINVFGELEDLNIVLLCQRRFQMYLNTRRYVFYAEGSNI